MPKPLKSQIQDITLNLKFQIDMIKVAIIDDQNIFRQSLSLLIKSVSEFDLVLEASNGEFLLDQFENMVQLPDVLLMDMNMPGINGIDLNHIIREKYPEIRVVVLSVHAQDRLISKMISAGSAAYLIKNCDKAELILAIKSTYETGFYMNNQVLLAIQKNNNNRSKNLNVFTGSSIELTSREKQILELICKEYSSAEIAEKLFLSIRTVEGHRNNLLLKTQSRNIAGLVLFAIRNQIFVVI